MFSACSNINAKPNVLFIQQMCIEYSVLGVVLSVQVIIVNQTDKFCFHGSLPSINGGQTDFNKENVKENLNRS